MIKFLAAVFLALASANAVKVRTTTNVVVLTVHDFEDSVLRNGGLAASFIIYDNSTLCNSPRL